MPTWINAEEIWNFEEKELFLSCSTRKMRYTRKTGKTTFCPKIDRMHTIWASLSGRINSSSFFLVLGISTLALLQRLLFLVMRKKMKKMLLVMKMEEDEEKTKKTRNIVPAENEVDQFLGQLSSYYLFN